MKIISVEISSEHFGDDSEIAPEDVKNESFQLSISSQVPDEVLASSVVPGLTAELLRRYNNLNARKTN